VAYAQTSKEISKWQPVIQKNRQAKSLSFPLNAPASLNVTSGLIIASHTPKTDLELEMQASLAASGVATEGDICRLEEMEMNKLSATEVEGRFKALAKQRSLLFFQERRQKHQSKIKSKKYRKIKAKAKSKEEAQKDAELTSAERREKAELARAKERLTLKTRRANKWAQEMIHRRGLESGSREEIIEQLRDKERIRQEIFGRAAEAGEGSEDEHDLYISGSEDEGNDKLNQEYFKDSENESCTASEANNSQDEDISESDFAYSTEEEEDAPVGRRTFGNIKEDGEPSEAEEIQHTAAKKAKKNSLDSKARSGRSHLFEVAQDDRLLAQQEIIKQAFAHDDLFAEFAAEKEGITQADAPKTEDLTLPGWGSWSGEGVPKTEPKVRVIKRIEGVDVKKRKDASLKHVIINEKQNKKLQATWMVPKVPYPYKSKEEYERATRMKPLGPEWNSTTTYKKRVEPRVQIKVGSIIGPIKFLKQPKY
jgi:U3 small nucleolar RNA-associated protein 14